MFHEISTRLLTGGSSLIGAAWGSATLCDWVSLAQCPSSILEDGEIDVLGLGREERTSYQRVSGSVRTGIGKPKRSISHREPEPPEVKTRICAISWVHPDGACRCTMQSISPLVTLVLWCVRPSLTDLVD